MPRKLTDLEKKGLGILYDDMQKDYSFHKDYWEWKEDGRGYLIVRKKR